jgi:hypothetical protein
MVSAKRGLPSFTPRALAAASANAARIAAADAFAANVRPDHPGNSE